MFFHPCEQNNQILLFSKLYFLTRILQVQYSAANARGPHGKDEISDGHGEVRNDAEHAFAHHANSHQVSSLCWAFEMLISPSNLQTIKVHLSSAGFADADQHITSLSLQSTQAIDKWSCLRTFYFFIPLPLCLLTCVNKTKTRMTLRTSTLTLNRT